MNLKSQNICLYYSLTVFPIQLRCLCHNKMLFMQWALMTLLEPARSLENLAYLGYVDLSAAIHVTRTRRHNRKKQQNDRNVIHCFVFGPKKAGKSALLNSFLGRCAIILVFFE